MLPVHCHVVAVPGAGGEQGPAGVDLYAVDAALLDTAVSGVAAARVTRQRHLVYLGGRQTVLAAVQARDLVRRLPRVHVQHHQLVALGPEYDLLVAQPLAAEHLVHVGLRDGVLLHHGVAEHVPGRVLGGEPHVLEPSVRAALPVHDAVHEVAGDAVAGLVNTRV